MKNTQMMSVFLGLFLLGSALPVRADMDKDHGPRMEKMHKELGLSDDQSAKLKTLWASEKDAMKPLMEKQHALMDKLKDQVKNKASDTDIQATLGDLKTNRDSLQSQRDQFQSQKAAILTPTQQAKMMIARYKHERGHKMHDKSEKPS